MRAWRFCTLAPMWAYAMTSKGLLDTGKTFNEAPPKEKLFLQLLPSKKIQMGKSELQQMMKWLHEKTYDEVGKLYEKYAFPQRQFEAYRHSVNPENMALSDGSGSLTPLLKAVMKGVNAKPSEADMGTEDSTDFSFRQLRTKAGK
ncbi:MAG: uncharacterized protein KVP18_003949 [Porospora cf. gigantea A]|uniref:uncharacterized protein n=2 Tax=Porospora cf. gigantea A TaxID=2853593 RepID=UPI003559A215|nr:MAG: hypothetical protein KVP18_003949 [Porospora cf. gigantea A]